MNLRGLVSLSGKPGLFKVIGQNKSGFILESLDGQKSKVVTNATSKLATLEDITIFGEDEDITLISVLEKMKEIAAEKAIPAVKADPAELKAYFSFIAPNHDTERVYVSDIKKIISWYAVLSALPLFNEQAPPLPGEEAKPEEPASEVQEEAKPAIKTTRKKKGSAE